MLLKKAKTKRVKTWRYQEITPEIYGCDCCKKEIKNFPNEIDRLRLTVFYKDSRDADDFHFCSWECVLNYLPKVKCDYFVSLPNLYYSGEYKKRNAAELLKLVSKSKKKTP